LANSNTKKEEAIIPSVGQVVRLRSRSWLVEGVDADADGKGHIVTLSCIDDDAQRQQLQVVWEVELNPQIVGEEAWETIGNKDKEPSFDAVRDFAAYFRTLRWNCVTSTNPRTFQSPFRAGIKLDPYQLVPLAKALQLPRVNLFIADDVGLGKTIEAGLVASELLLRKRIDTVIVACPPSMIYQWRDELESKFGLDFRILDRAYVRQMREQRGHATNPWETHPNLIVSHRLLIDETYAGPLRSFLGNLKPGSLLILDECHNAAPSSGVKYANDTKITRAIRDLASGFEHRLFLSATPHNGHSNSYSALLELLDPQRFCRGTKVEHDSDAIKNVMVRRLKEDIREVTGGGFPKRETPAIKIDGLPLDSPELVLPELLDEYRKVRQKRVDGLAKSKQSISAIVISGLQQRLLSSPKAFSRTLRKHKETMERLWAGEKIIPQNVSAEVEVLVSAGGADFDSERANLSEEEQYAVEESGFTVATLASAGDSDKADVTKEKMLLERMLEVSAKAESQADSRVVWLLKHIKETMCDGVGIPGGPRPTPGAKWNEKRIILFTQWEDTLTWLHNNLKSSIAGTDGENFRIEVYKGSTSDDRREAIKAAFNADPKKEPVRILSCNDAAREGLNLQAHCSELIHFDLPWNPGRLEQRNGRIDRKMQPAETVYCRYFIYAQRPEDRILQVLIEKGERIRRELGTTGKVLEDKMSDYLRKGIIRDEIEETKKWLQGVDFEKRQKEAIQQELDGVRRREEIKKSIDEMRDCLSESRNSIGLTTDHLLDALDVACDKLQMGHIKKVESPDGPDRYMLPENIGKMDVDGSWSTTLDTLRLPPRDGVKGEVWRKNSPIRPIVLEPVDKIDDTVTQVHLDHKLVKRLLDRFRTQGFVNNDLSRACLTQTEDSIPRVVLIGRILVVGHQASRLHEQLVFVTARISETSSELKPYTDDEEEKTMAIMETALSSKSPKIPDHVLKKLLGRIQGDVKQLKEFLQKRAKSEETIARKALKLRADTEEKVMRQILEQQRDRITATLKDGNQMQLPLGHTKDDERQFRSEQNHMLRRLASIPAELASEPVRIRKYYDVVSVQVQPVGLAYLWPKTN
jgi:Helicase conserved C-terminal domain/SNF2-related domain